MVDRTGSARRGSSLRVRSEGPSSSSASGSHPTLATDRRTLPWNDCRAGAPGTLHAALRESGTAKRQNSGSRLDFGGLLVNGRGGQFSCRPNEIQLGIPGGWLPTECRRLEREGALGQMLGSVRGRFSKLRHSAIRTKPLTAPPQNFSRALLENCRHCRRGLSRRRIYHKNGDRRC
jgi:hypothetical protein